MPTHLANIQKSSAKSPLVSVVILNYNGLKYMGTGLRECLDSVLMSDYPNLEVIFVDNGSVDKSASFIEENFRSKVRVIRNNSNLGFSEGFNTGIRGSKGEYVTLLSNDMTVERNWLNPIIDLMESNPQVGLGGFKRFRVGAQGSDKLLDGIGGDLYLCGRVKPIGHKEIDKAQYDTNIDNLDFIGGAMVLRRKTLQRVGLLDPVFSVFSEDVDLCFRIRKSGYKTVYVHNAEIWHKGQATIKGMDPKGSYLEYMGYRNRIRCNLIHFTLKRILATFLIDAVWFFTMRSIKSKKILLKAYLWNLSNIAVTLDKRLAYGPSPPFGCKSPVISFNLSDIKKWILAAFGFQVNRKLAN